MNECQSGYVCVCVCVVSDAAEIILGRAIVVSDACLGARPIEIDRMDQPLITSIDSIDGRASMSPAAAHTSRQGSVVLPPHSLRAPHEACFPPFFGAIYEHSRRQRTSRAQPAPHQSKIRGASVTSFLFPLLLLGVLGFQSTHQGQQREPLSRGRPMVSIGSFFSYMSSHPPNTPLSSVFNKRGQTHVLYCCLSINFSLSRRISWVRRVL